MEEQEREQNKRINQHQRLINNLRERLKTVEVDVEPDGRISEAFEQIEQHLERHDKRFDRLEHKVNQLGSKLDIIIEHLTSINDLPEE
ncbi:MAG: hypothetical protein AB4426_02055 [Xenococcaceae cyanobacterium]